jgi:hypothetical protein
LLNRFSKLQPPLGVDGLQMRPLRIRSNVAWVVEKALLNAASEVPATTMLLRIPSKWGFADPFATSTQLTVPERPSPSGLVKLNRVEAPAGVVIGKIVPPPFAAVKIPPFVLVVKEYDPAGSAPKLAIPERVQSVPVKPGLRQDDPVPKAMFIELALVA